MKTNLHALLFCPLFVYTALAADDSLDLEPSRKQPSKAPEWSVRVEVLMVSMPQDRALALLPDLRAPEKIDGAATQIMDAIQQKEATLIGYPVVYTLDGERGIAETTSEKRYPTEFEPPPSRQESGEIPQPPPASPPSSDTPIPTTFETRNLGVTLEVEPHVLPPGDLVSLVVLPQRVTLLRFDSYDAAKTKSGKVIKIEQPNFASTRNTAAIVLRNGQRSLLAIHKRFEPETEIELFIIQAFFSPIR